MPSSVWSRHVTPRARSYRRSAPSSVASTSPATSSANASRLTRPGRPIGSDLEEALQARVALELLHERAHLGLALARQDEHAVSVLDHDQVLEAERDDEARVGQHDGVLRVDAQVQALDDV